MRLASDLADSKGYGIFDPDQIQLEGHPALAFFDITQEELAALSESLDEMLDSNIGTFGTIS